VEFFPGSGRSLVRIYIDGVDGVDVEDCAKVSRHLGVALEVEDIIPGAYTLEVSSPGLTRTFFSPGQLGAYLGRTIELTLAAPREGRKRFCGTLSRVKGDALVVEVEGASQSFAWDQIGKAKLVHEFSRQTQLDGQGAKGAKPRTGGSK
ncbi:MAG: ribosome maturation factor RimP, partial [Desulfovibrionaceae bacterium]|nr:ribosome maturation factor RimP [Desulfovibrionaceae bacterium]